VTALRAIGAYALAAFEGDDPGTRTFQAATESGGLLVWLAELDVYQITASTSVPTVYGLGTHPLGALATVAEAVGGTTTLRVSDRGYLSLSSDSLGVQLFLPYLQLALSIDRRLPISPEAGSRVGASWGDLILSNPRQASGAGYWDSIVSSYAIDGRTVRVLLGQKTWDSSRGLWVDPAYSSFQPVFTGVALGWFNDGEIVRVAVRDRLYALEVPLSQIFYTGAGGLNGTETVSGKPVPKTRGTVSNISPLLIDETRWIYQYNDAAGSIATLYERGISTYAYNGDLSTLGGTLLTTTGAAGTWTSDNANGRFRLFPAGGTPAGQITIDVTGSGPYGTWTTPAMIAFQFLFEAGLTESQVNRGSFLGLDAVCSWTAGIYLPDQTVAISAISELLAGTGAALGTDRQSRAAVFRLPTSALTPQASFDTRQIVKVTARALPESVSPPNWRRTVAYGKNYTVQTSDVASTITAAHKAFIGVEWRTAAWADASKLVSYLRASDAPTAETLLTTAADALTFAAYLGALWGTQRALYDVVLKYQSFTLDFGAPLLVQYPIADLTSGKVVTFVGERIDSAREETILTVLT
jgi:hypothetical protein